MRCLVTGCAGFIGSTLVDKLLAEGYEVIGLDNLSTGRKKFLSNALKSDKFQFIFADLYEDENIAKYFKNVDIVFHLAANADVRFGLEHPRRDLEQNTIVTFNVLEAMRQSNCQKIVFSSTGSVYGEASVIPTPEDAPLPIQTSLYGASKLACEGLISAYCEGFDIQSWIFRFVSILGPRYTHGHVYDFYLQLLHDSANLSILGNGKQRKSYLHVDDCVNGILCAISHGEKKINIYNLGQNSYCQVNDSVSWICEEVGAEPHKIYSGGDRGWVGDNPFIFLDTSRICSLGWKPHHSIEDGVKSTVNFFKNNEWVFYEE